VAGEESLARDLKEETMKKTYWTFPVLILVFLLGSASLPGAACAQGVVSLAIDELQFAEFPEAKALVTVRNENGVPISGLGADKFEIVEDGRASFPPSGVATQVNPNAVVSVVMVIDISGSMKGKPIQEAMRAANALLEQFSAQDRAALIAFADEIKSLDPANLEEGKEVAFTTDKNAIRNVVNFLDTKIGWDTPLYDAIYKGVKMVATEPVGKRAVIVMTDGRDERDINGVTTKDAGSQSTPDDPIQEANRHNIPIFSVGLVGLGGKIDSKYLARLAERTGGTYQEAPQPEELTPLFQNALDQLKQQYVLTFQSTVPKDANYHSLLIRVQLPQGQAFGETKFQILEEAPPATSLAATGSSGAASSSSSGSTVDQAGSAVQSEPAQVPTPEPAGAASGVQGIIDTVKDTIQERPALAIVIAAGVLLLVILIIALLIVLLRGRKVPEEEIYAPSADLGEPYAAAPSWTPAPVGPATPAMGTPTAMEGKTEFAPPGWPEPAPPAGPAMPPFGPSPGPVGAEPGVPPAGGTRIIERAPKHLAMLVDKARPDRKFDLKGTINVGRARDNQIVLEDPTVSRHHAWIKSEGEDFLVFDVGSGNGTFVNDDRVTEPRRLENGDVVRFGDATFVFTKVF
jgi:VWFA-related protein